MLGEDGKTQIFVPTELAKTLCSVLPDSLKSASSTAEWEAKLSEVEKGNMEPKVFLEQIQEYIRKTLSDTSE